MTPLDEVALRREGFTEGIRVTLGDGQSWALPEHWFWFFPAVDPAWKEGDDPSGRCVTKALATRGPEFRKYERRAIGSDQPDDFAELISARLLLASLLLAKNYDIPDEAVPDLLNVDTGDPSSMARLGQLADALAGLTPKGDNADG